jgi:hypothetical protein
MQGFFSENSGYSQKQMPCFFERIQTTMTCAVLSPMKGKNKNGFTDDKNYDEVRQHMQPFP